MKKYPFKFLDSYEREDRQIFFGRDEEIQSLYEMVFQSDLIVVYGASGTGKTSLINCGLAGKFAPHDWLPLMRRRGKNIHDSLQNTLKTAGGNVENSSTWNDDFEGLNSEEKIPSSPVEKAVKSIYQKQFRPVYLIFDQLEELFIIGHKPEQQEFIKTIKELVQSELPVKIIFSIREEYLGYLYDFERAIPSLLNKKLRVEPMNLEKVKQVITGIANFENTNVEIKKDEHKQLAENIFQKLKDKENSRTIQLPFLQVFLDKFYLQVTNDQSRTEKAELSLKALLEMGDIDDVLVDFLEEQVATVSSKYKQKYPELDKELIWKILSPFATLEGTKEPIGAQELIKRLPNLKPELINELLLEFVNSRLLRYNENTETYEISHDSLAKPISEKRSVEENALLEVRRLISSQVSVNKEAREYFTEKQLLFIEPYLNRFKLDPEEEKWIHESNQALLKQRKENAALEAKEIVKSKRARYLKNTVIGSSIAAVLFIALAIFAVSKTYDAQKNNKLAEEAKGKLLIENEYINGLMREIMKGRGAQYQNLSDSELRDEIEMERNADVASLIKIRASEIAVDSSDTIKNFTLWLDVPSFKIYELKKVDYLLCEEIVYSVRSSEEPSSAFAIGFSFNRYCDTIQVDIIKTTGDTIHRDFPFKAYFEEQKKSLH